MWKWRKHVLLTIISQIIFNFQNFFSYFTGLRIPRNMEGSGLLRRRRREGKNTFKNILFTTSGKPTGLSFSHSQVGSLTLDQLSHFWRGVTASNHDEASQFVHVLTRYLWHTLRYLNRCYVWESACFVKVIQGSATSFNPPQIMWLYDHIDPMCNLLLLKKLKN